MSFALASLLDPAVLLGTGGGTSVLAFVGARFHRLEKEVRACRSRDAEVKIIMAGVRVVVGKILRDDPDSMELRMFQDLCSRRLGPPPSIEDFAGLLGEIDAAVPDYQPPEKRRGARD